MQDEVDAKKQLDQKWAKLGAKAKGECVGESSAGDDQSYVELLTCLQMTSDWNHQSTVGHAWDFNLPPKLFSFGGESYFCLSGKNTGRARN